MLLNDLVAEYIKRTSKSRELYEELSEYLPGGVGSHIRWFEPYPFYLDRADGARVWDVDGNCYVDYVMAWGPLLFGHRRPRAVIEAVKRQLEEGVIYGIPSKLMRSTISMIKKLVPCARAVKFANTGTEAVMHAVRIARAFTHRKKILKFEGAFHGYSSEAWISVAPDISEAGSYERPKPVPDCAGITEEQASNFIISHWNDSEHFRRVFREHKDELAAVLATPINTGLGAIPPRDGFLQTIREETEKHGIPLIFDEVTTGFRVGRSSGQGLYGVIPDIATFGKIIGGGLPIGVICGREDILEVTDPAKGTHPVAGTFTTNPISLVACNTMLQEIERDENLYERLDKDTAKLVEGIGEILEREDVDYYLSRVGSMFQIYFTEGGREVLNYRDTLKIDRKMFRVFFLALLNNGVFSSPRLLGRWYLSAAHSSEELGETLAAVEKAAKSLKKLKTA